MTTSSGPIKHWYRVYFHDGKTLDFETVNSLVAEMKAHAAHPGGFVKKVAFLKGKSNAR